MSYTLMGSILGVITFGCLLASAVSKSWQGALGFIAGCLTCATIVLAIYESKQ